MAKTQRTTAVSFGGTTITSVVDVSVSEDASEEMLHTDAADAVQMVFADAAHCRISVTVADLSFRNGRVPGDTGSLVITRKERANGKGDGAGTQIETYAEAVYLGCQDQAGTAGNGSLVLNFAAVASNGTFASVVAYS